MKPIAIIAIFSLSACTYPGAGYDHIQPDYQKPLKVNCVKYHNDQCKAWELK